MLISNLLEPTIDYVFKRIFGHVGNERITADLLSNILQEKIEDINLDCNTFINKDITAAITETVSIISFFKKEKDTDKSFPRKYNIIKKNPL